MGREDRPGLTGEAQTRDLLRREAAAAHQASASGSSAGSSPPALEATLASISAEVTAEAIERLAHATKLEQQRAKAARDQRPGTS